MILRVALVLLVMLLAFPVRSEDTSSPSPFRIRPYLQNPTPDAMTIRWFSDSPDPGTLTLGPASSVPTKPSQQYVSAPILCRTLDYQLAEPREERHESLPFLHSLRLEGLAPATSYPYQVEQNGVTIKAILTTAPLPGKVGRGGGVRLFFYADSETQPESRGSRVQWPASPSQPSGPRPRWVADTYLADETTGYRMNLSLIATRAAESLRAGNPVLASVVGEQRDWDEFWRHNAGVFGTLASRVPIVAALGNHEMFGGPASDDPGKHLGGYSGSASLASSQKFLLYFQHPANGATDPRHDNRYHRINFGPSRCSRSIPPTAGVRTEPTIPTTPSTMPTHLTFLTTAPAHSSTRGLKRNSPPPKNVGQSHSCSFTTRHSRPGRMDCLPARKKTATVNRASRCVCSPSSFPRMACELFSLGTTRCTSTPL